MTRLTCSWCNINTIEEDEFHGIGSFICETCYQNTRICRHCEDRFESTEAVYCNDCPSSYFYQTDYKPIPIFKGKGPLFFGVELEAELPTSIPHRTIIQNLSEFKSLIYLKEDGSLDYGVEIVTHPFSLRYHLIQFEWEKLCQIMQLGGAQSHDTCTCGFHVHVSRAALTESDEIKLAFFLHTQRDLVWKIARRTATEYCVTQHKSKPKKEDRKNYSRHEVINFKNENTVEFRPFRGTLKATTILATLEFVDALIHFVKITSVIKIADAAKLSSLFLRYAKIHKKKYYHLSEYLKEIL